MTVFKTILLIFLVLCAVSVSLTKKLMTSVVIYLSFSTVMAVIWVLLRSPDLAITEAAVGVGVTGILFFITLKKIHLMTGTDEPTPESEELAAMEAPAREESGDGKEAR